ncbi:aromatic acid exporter family protein [Streptomyces sp. ACA25]|uniref:FUSC family protein n=1 Tax=Streptomyces sp. ACA25 TaxID=3022596 RepID=UPI0023076808|nr:aromatic acid exporter family protein [Streptomyces sp. ACA25]MDB1088571.1 aromatic acid exporter family protein [Streptomyces sp. ACA25]
MVDLAKRRERVVTQTLRSTVAATLAYLAALWLTDSQAPLLAPLTALLVVQVTLYATLTSGLRRVNAVVAGVTLAVGFSALVGLSWWSLALLIFASLTLGHVVRAGQFVPEVAISAMLVLSVTRAAEVGVARVVETLIGAAVGLLFNVIFVPPVRVRPAEEAIEDLGRRMQRLLQRMGDEVIGHTPVERAAAKLYEARELDRDITQVDASLSEAEESLRFNPRVKEGLLTRIVLRTGLDTLEICAVILRTTSRTLTDLAGKRTEESLYTPELADALQALFTHLAGALDSFAVLITTQVSSSADAAEKRLLEELDAGHAGRERVARLLLANVQRHPRQWQLHGSLLSDIDRMLAELDVERRSMRLADELDRHSREQAKHPSLPRRAMQRLMAPIDRRVEI